MHSHSNEAQHGPDRERWNLKIHAFTEFGETRLTEPTNRAGLVENTTVGVKDIIDVAGLPTRNGSDAYARAVAATEDATVVAALRAAGARILGKTATTEFAFTDPTDCRNPYDLRRSPGGSSSGSGAAVAAGMVDIALGTQTAGSLCRPAAYCGAVGFKPSFGALDTRGVTPLAPSFDTVGIIARSVDLAKAAFAAMRCDDERGMAQHRGANTVAAFLLDATTDVWPETRAAFQEAREAVSQRFIETPPPDLGVDIDKVVSDHRIVMNHEACQAHGHLLTNGSAHLLKPKFRAGLTAGAGVSEEAARAASERLDAARRAFWRSMGSVDAILTLPVPDGAPLIDGTTGFQDWLTPWTVFGGPLLCLPWGLDTLGRPRSVMLAGRPGGDATLLATGKILEAEAPDLPRPVLPD